MNRLPTDVLGLIFDYIPTQEWINFPDESVAKRVFISKITINNKVQLQTLQQVFELVTFSQSSDYDPDFPRYFAICDGSKQCRCALCESFICEGCAQECFDCGKIMCEDHYDKCDRCDNYFCRYGMEDTNCIDKCPDCIESVCRDCGFVCIDCKYTIMCEDDVTMCHACNETVCRRCNCEPFMSRTSLVYCKRCTFI